MRLFAFILQNVLRLIGLVLLLLGFLFWSGHSFEFVPIHMGLGVALVALLWIIAGIALAAGVKPGLAVAAILWGLLTLFFGMTMGHMLPGRAHEAIRVIHFLIGISAIGLAEMLGARIKSAVGP